MADKGFAHSGLSTLDLDKTRDFYENVLGFRTVRFDAIEIEEGGQLRTQKKISPKEGRYDSTSESTIANYLGQ
jgi:catechol 2,3-dioxygenase-like lactoylglutathione lyase family enzyme